MYRRVALGVLFASLSAIHGDEKPGCLMTPEYVDIRVPAKGLSWLEASGFSGECDVADPEKWELVSSKTFKAFLNVRGPEGSGRYWVVAVGFGPEQRIAPVRGFCLSTSTVGWRTLARYDRPLAWLEDLDDDGESELVIWGSFPLTEDASLAEYGLVAWVYRVVPDGVFKMDWNQSRDLAKELSGAYRTPLDDKYGPPADLRDQVAKALEDFASGKCAVKIGPAR